MVTARVCIQALWLLTWQALLAKGFAVSKTSATSRRRRFYPCLSASSDTNIREAETESSNKQLHDALAKMDVMMHDEFYDRDPSLKQLYSKICKNVEIRKSSIDGAGYGLFAKKPMKANTIVSFYPAHALGTDSESPFVTTNADDASYFNENPSSRSSYLHCTDQPLFQRPSVLGKDNPTPIYLDVNPTQQQQSGGWLSHYINDGATVESNTEAGVLDYYQKTKAAKNCIHIPLGPSPVLATVTTKKVKKGEELFTSYGGTYWLGVWLDVHGEEGVGITPQIQAEIQQSAKDLVASMKAVSVVYEKQIDILRLQFDSIVTA